MNSTIKIDILNESVLKILEGLESMKLIKLHTEKKTVETVDFISKFKGKLSPQSISEIDKQLNELRNSWQ